MKLEEAVYNNFKVGERITNVEVKERLTKIHKELDIKGRIAATHIKKYFIATIINVPVGDKRKKGYHLISPLSGEAENALTLANIILIENRDEYRELKTKIIGNIMMKCKIGAFISYKDLKVVLQDIYDKYDIKSIACATDVKHFLRVFDTSRNQACGFTLMGVK